MFISVKFILFVVVGCCSWVRNSGAATQRQKIPLHELMTELEREYYFGTFNRGNRGAAPEYQLVYLPAVLPQAASSDGSQDDQTIEYSFSALGRKFELELKPNRLLLSPNFKVFSNGVNGIHYEPYLSQASVDCHYLHHRNETVAAISTCKRDSLHGVIVTSNSSFEIRPLSAALSQRVNLTEPWSRAKLAARLATYPHIVRRAPIPPYPFADDYMSRRKRAKPHFDWTSEPKSAQSEPADPDNTREPTSLPANYTLEVALFMDEAAYNRFYPYFGRNEKDVRDMMLAYMNGVQALYHHPSLGTRLDISLVRLELQRRQPHDLPHYDGERGSLLDSFCAYQARLNEKDDAHPDHWDMALYVSGLDFFVYKDGRKNDETLGLAYVGGVCRASQACVIVELGVTNAFGNPHISAGFTSVYILAHEIGHNLGMNHDSKYNSCSKDGFIMSPSQDNDGETIWSPCSVQAMTQLSGATCLQDPANSPKPDLDHAQHGDAPGVAWGSKRQCEVLLRDRDAVPVGATPCRQLQCRSPHRTGYYLAGPALPGTPCGNFLWCKGGECVSRETARPTPPKVSGFQNELKIHLQPDDLPLLGKADSKEKRIRIYLRNYLSLHDHAVPRTRIHTKLRVKTGG